MNEVRFDEAVRPAAEAVLAQRASALQALGLRTTVEVRRWSQQGVAKAEVRVAFWRGNEFIDVVEDFVVQDGQPVASLDDLREWLEQCVETVLAETSPP